MKGDEGRTLPTDASPFVRAAIMAATPESTDRTILDQVMREMGGKANPIKVAEMIVRSRGGDGTIVAPPASPFNFIGEPTQPLTPRYIVGFGVSWEPVE